MDAHECMVFNRTPGDEHAKKLFLDDDGLGEARLTLRRAPRTAVEHSTSEIVIQS